MADQESHKPIGGRIRKLREQRGWSLGDLAKRSAISRSYLFRIEEGKSSPTYAKIQSLADAFGVLPSELLGEEYQFEHISESLRDFAQEELLGSREITMLAQIEYRGKKPESAKEWRAIYSIIKAMVEK